MMDTISEKVLQAEIRRQAFIAADTLKRKKQMNASIRRTILALNDVTGLAQTELENIAMQVTRRFENRDRFFSIRQQLLWTATGGAIFILIGLVIGCMVF